jgi:Ser/Thr protein kinase RdoA (MazF antagonist)
MSNYFSVTHSTLSTKALMAEILPDYDIGTPMECKFLTQGLNDTYLVKTTTEQYILRAYRTGWRSLSDIHYELEALLHLKRLNTSVSAPVLRKNGELLHTISAPEGSRTIVLFTYALGKEPAYAANEESESYQYGRSVAQIHSETDGFQSQHQRFHLDLEYLLDAPLKSIRPLLLHRPDDWEYLQSLSEKLRQDVVGIPLSSLESGFCHGDFHGGNVHIDQDDTLTFFDFDCCGYGWRAYDIAVFRWGARGRSKEQERWPHFLRGYREVRPISEADLHATLYFVAIRQFWLLGLHASNGEDLGFGFMDDQYFDWTIKFFREWEAEQTDEKQLDQASIRRHKLGYS